MLPQRVPPPPRKNGAAAKNLDQARNEDRVGVVVSGAKIEEANGFYLPDGKRYGVTAYRKQHGEQTMNYNSNSTRWYISENYLGSWYRSKVVQDGDECNTPPRDGWEAGQGKVTLADGHVYKGEGKDDKTRVYSKRTWADGRVYEGKYKDDKKHGHGKYTWANGSVHAGEWKDEKRHGHGKYTSADGHVYEGEWKDDKKHGDGKYTLADGSVHEGGWKDDTISLPPCDGSETGLPPSSFLGQPPASTVRAHGAAQPEGDAAQVGGCSPKGTAPKSQVGM